MPTVNDSVQQRPKYFLGVALIAFALSIFAFSRGDDPTGRFLGMPGWLLGSVLLAGGLLVGGIALRTMAAQRR